MSDNASAKIPHPIGSLVEITSKCPQGEHGSVMEGVRLFVVAHSRDFDGSILHSLAADVGVCLRISEIEAERALNPVKEHDHVFQEAFLRAKGEISDGWGSEDLLCVREPNLASAA